MPQTINKDDLFKLWLALFKAETVEELEKIKSLGAPVMEEAKVAYNSITATPEFREMERLRAKARHDEAQALWNAENRGKQQGIEQGLEQGLEQGMERKALAIAKNLLEMDIPIDKIILATGLTHEEVEQLRDSNK